MRIEAATERRSGLPQSLVVSVIIHVALVLIFWKVGEKLVRYAPAIVEFVVTESTHKPPEEKKPPKLLPPEPKDVTPLQEVTQTQPLRASLPDEELNPLLPKGPPRELDDLRPRIATLRREDESLPGLAVSGAKRTDDGTSSLRGAFHGVDRKKGDDFVPDGLPPHFGTGNRGMRGGREGGTGEGSGTRNFFKPRPSQRGDLDAPAAVPVPAREKRSKPAELITDARGTWRRIETPGPLSHLNARCYDVPHGTIVYADDSRLRLRCGENQIIEAWRREQ